MTSFPTVNGSTSVGDANLPVILPLVLYHLTPEVVAIIGLGALSAAVMSSADSAILSSASMFTHNVYSVIVPRIIYANSVKKREISAFHCNMVQRISIFCIGAISTVLAITIDSVYGAFVIAGDLAFCLSFPQLTSVLFMPYSNGYGSLIGFVTAVVLRFGAGEPTLSLEPFLIFPYYDEINKVQRFPFRTFIAFVSFCIIVIVSWITELLFEKGIIDPKCDFLDSERARGYHRKSAVLARRAEQNERTGVILLERRSIAGDNVAFDSGDDALRL